MKHILPLLQVAFIIMQVAGVIKWSWWQVFIPVYIYVGLVFLGILCHFVARACESPSERAERQLRELMKRLR